MNLDPLTVPEYLDVGKSAFVLAGAKKPSPLSPGFTSKQTLIDFRISQFDTHSFTTLTTRRVKVLNYYVLTVDRKTTVYDSYELSFKAMATRAANKRVCPISPLLRHKLL